MADLLEIRKLLTRAVERAYPNEDAVLKILTSGRRLTVYLGVDPTGPHLHLGHATNLLLLKRFQELGHRVYFVIGDFTARIGDPTDKLAPRRALTAKEVALNLKTFKQQAGKLLRFTGQNAAQIKFNSQWYKRLPLTDFLGLAECFTVSQLLERDMFQARLKDGKPIWLSEFLYPLFQGYDSVALAVDGEIGGRDQTFNMLAGRDLLKSCLARDKFVIITRLLVNPKTGGKLMNKSEGGLINLDDDPNDMYGKVMALPDEVILPLAELATAMSDDECRVLGEELNGGRINPRDVKARVADAVVRLYHNSRAAAAARVRFADTFQRDRLPVEKLPMIAVASGTALAAALATAGLVKSNSDFRRLVLAGAIEVDGERLTDFQSKLVRDGVFKVGKRRWVRVKVK